MPIISVRDNENNRRKRNSERKSQKRTRGMKAIVKVLSIILIERELYESKHVTVECRCLKIWDLLSFLICSSILVLKWRQVSPM